MLSTLPAIKVLKAAQPVAAVADGKQDLRTSHKMTHLSFFRSVHPGADKCAGTLSRIKTGLEELT